MSANLIRINAQDPNPLAFDDMRGVLRGKREQLEYMMRRGYSGEEYRTTGVRAPVSEVVTERYYLNRADAVAAMEVYYALIGEIREFVQHGQSFGLYLIENANQIEEIAARAGVSGAPVQANASVMMAVRWQVRNQPAS